MSKKSSKHSFGKIFSLVSIVLSIASIVFMFLPFYHLFTGDKNLGTEISQSGFSLAFGGKYKTTGWLLGNGTTTELSHELYAGILVGFILIAVSILLLVVYTLTKGNKAIRIAFVGLAVLCLIAGGVLFFCVTPLTNAPSNALGVGAILSGICALVAAVSSIFTLLLDLR